MSTIPDINHRIPDPCNLDVLLQMSTNAHKVPQTSVIPRMRHVSTSVAATTADATMDSAEMDIHVFVSKQFHCREENK